MKGGLYGGTPKEGHPPPIAERQKPFTPIIFRTKNTEKSQPAFGWKKFRKIFAGKCFGEEKAPNLEERGRGVLKYER